MPIIVTLQIPDFGIRDFVVYSFLTLQHPKTGYFSPVLKCHLIPGQEDPIFECRSITGPFGIRTSFHHLAVKCLCLSLYTFIMKMVKIQLQNEPCFDA